MVQEVEEKFMSAVTHSLPVMSICMWLMMSLCASFSLIVETFQPSLLVDSATCSPPLHATSNLDSTSCQPCSPSRDRPLHQPPPLHHLPSNVASEVSDWISSNHPLPFCLQLPHPSVRVDYQLPSTCCWSCPHRFCYTPDHPDTSTPDLPHSWACYKKSYFNQS